MKTTNKRNFDAVAESRKWRKKTSLLLSTMTQAERIAFINRRIADLPKLRPEKHAASASS